MSDRLDRAPCAPKKQVYTYNCDTQSFEIFQSFYTTRNPMRIRPDVVILDGKTQEIMFQTNQYGFKSAAIDQTKELVAVWGDSVIFCVAPQNWVTDLDHDFSGYQFHNGGLEGDILQNIIQRTEETNAVLPIKVNILFPGWHNWQNQDRIKLLLEHFISSVPGPMLCTVPTCMTPEIVQTDISSIFPASEAPCMQNVNHPDCFAFFGSMPYSLDNARMIWKYVLAQNDIIRKTAEAHSVPVIDLFSHLRPDGLDDFRNDFFDICHPRPCAYSKIRAIFREALKDLLA